MPPIKPILWRQIAQQMLHACLDEEGPIEARFVDSIRDTVGNYLDHSYFIDDIATADPEYRKKPIVILGRVAINTTDLQSWINKNSTAQVLSVKALASMLNAMGAVQMTVPVKRREQSRYLLPIEHFDPADYQKTTPEPAQDSEVATDTTTRVN